MSARHCVRPGAGALGVGTMAVVAVEVGEGGDEIALTLGGRAQLTRLRNERTARRQLGRCGRLPQRMVVRSRHAPPGDAAVRISLRGVMERLLRLLEPERVQQGKAALKIRLRFRGTGSDEVHASELFRRLAGVLVAVVGGEEERGSEKNSSQRTHGNPPPRGRVFIVPKPLPGGLAEAGGRLGTP